MDRWQIVLIKGEDSTSLEEVKEILYLHDKSHLSKDKLNAFGEYEEQCTDVNLRLRQGLSTDVQPRAETSPSL